MTYPLQRHNFLLVTATELHWQLELGSKCLNPPADMNDVHRDGEACLSVHTEKDPTTTKRGESLGRAEGQHMRCGTDEAYIPFS